MELPPLKQHSHFFVTVLLFIISLHIFRNTVPVFFG